MKQKSANQKTSQRTPQTVEQASSAGSNGLALAPPAYGIGSVDHGLPEAQASRGAVTQRLADVANTGTNAEARTENKTGLPDNLKAGIESLSGLALDNVRVHYNSDKPAQLQALAYTRGTEIHVAPGQERYLPHEAWHVVQQAQGRVKPTMQMKGGVLVNDDPGLEREADLMSTGLVADGVKQPTRQRARPDLQAPQRSDHSAPVQRKPPKGKQEQGAKWEESENPEWDLYFEKMDGNKIIFNDSPILMGYRIVYNPTTREYSGFDEHKTVPPKLGSGENDNNAPPPNIPQTFDPPERKWYWPAGRGPQYTARGSGLNDNNAPPLVIPQTLNPQVGGMRDRQHPTGESSLNDNNAPPPNVPQTLNPPERKWDWLASRGPKPGVWTCLEFEREAADLTDEIKGLQIYEDLKWGLTGFTDACRVALNSGKGELAILEAQTSGHLRLAALAVRIALKSIDSLLEEIGKRNKFGEKMKMPRSRVALLKLRDQFRDNAMIRVIDILDQAYKEFILVKTNEDDEKRVAKWQTGRDGELKLIKEKLGGGAINTVSLLEHINTKVKYVFKADKREGMAALDAVGSNIKEEHAKPFSNRAVAMYRLDQLLGFDVIPETHFAASGGLFGHIMILATGQSPQQEIILSIEQSIILENPEGRLDLEKLRKRQQGVDEAYRELLSTGPLPGQRDVVFDLRRDLGQNYLRQGKNRYRIKHANYNFDYSNEEIQKGLTSLQLVDLIAGQLDRHPGNYFIGVDVEGNVRVTAIDNDAAFGAKHHDLKVQTWGSHLPGLPLVVSQEQYDKIMKVESDQVRRVVSPLLSPAETEATIIRFEQVQKHLEQLKTNQNVVKSFDRDTAIDLVQADKDKDPSKHFSSYVGREARLTRNRFMESHGKLVLDAIQVNKDLPTSDPRRPYKRLPPKPPF